MSELSGEHASPSGSLDSSRHRPVTRPAIRLDRVTVQVPGATLLREISWTLPQGTRAAVLGPNGAGKSTLLRAVTAYGHVTSGTVEVLGEQLGRTDVHQLRRRLGIVDPRLVRFLDREVTAHQLVVAGFRGHLTTFFDRPTADQEEAAQQVLGEVGLADRGEQPFATLSSGQQTRVWLARALVHHPELLILDEPTADLDLLARETLLATLHALLGRRPRLTVLTVTHHLEDLLPDTEQVLLLKNGTLFAGGPPEEVLTDKLLGQLFDCPVHVACHQGRWSWRVSAQAWPGLVN